MFNIDPLLRDYKNINITINSEQLIEIINYCIQKTKESLEDVIVSENQESYIDAQQVCDMLGINMTTLWRWEKKEYLISTKVGGKRIFKYSEIKKIIEGGLKNEKE